MKKRMDIRNFYVDELFITEKTWEKLADIAKREGSSRSAIVRRLVKDYVRAHAPGNPQQRLDRIIKTGRPYRWDPKMCGFCTSHARFIAEHMKGAKRYACERHAKLLEQHENWTIKPLKQ